MITLLMIPRLSDIAVFCDEVLIGTQAADFSLVKGAFYNHFGTVAGTLPIVTTAPFVAVFGLNDYAIRLPSLIFTICTVFALWRALSSLRAPAPWLGALMFIGTPQVLHMTRINFGHAPSLFFISLGLYFWSRKGKGTGAVAAGFCWGIAAYGYPGYMVLIPILVTTMIACSLSPLRRSDNDARFIYGAAATSAFVFIPIMIRATTDPEHFFARANLKNQGASSLISMDTIVNAVQNYPKYLTLNYLFVNGESGFDYSEIQRHSLTHSGILPWAFLPLALACTIRFASARSNYPQKWAAPFILLMWLAPLPDLATTTPMSPPYSFALAMSTFTIPFVASAGIADCSHYLGRLLGRRFNIIQPLKLLMMTQTVLLLLAILPTYPWHSSGYWGWQYGMEPIVKYYEHHRHEYTSLRVDPWFNQPKTLAQYHLEDESLIETIDFAVSPPTGHYESGVIVAIGAEYTSVEAYKQHGWYVVETLHYPNGETAWYLITPPPP